MKLFNTVFLIIYAGFLLAVCAMSTAHAAGVELTAPAFTVDTVIDIASKVIAASAAIAAVLPVPNKVNTGIYLLRRTLDFLAFNFGNAKNK